MSQAVSLNHTSGAAYLCSLRSDGKAAPPGAPPAAIPAPTHAQGHSVSSAALAPEWDPEWEGTPEGDEQLDAHAAVARPVTPCLFQIHASCF